jgi:membrane associated rhomboid family serine protease
MAGPMASPETSEETTVCYRHPGRETAVSCSECGRPICTDCMVFAPVGIKCPECAGQPRGARRATTRLRTAAAERGESHATRSLIALNVAVFVVQLVDSGGDLRGVSGELVARGALYGPAIAHGDWWRLVTSGFLHYGIVHVAFNMLMLWWFGRPLEALLGSARFLAVYGVSILTGSAGALLMNPDTPTLGASAAVFGVLGAGLALERRQIYVFGGGAFLVVAFNLLFSLVTARVSIGGHLGGLIGGILAVLALSHLGRRHAVYGRPGVAGIAALVAIALVSVAIAYGRVRGLA